jgi:hydrogenase expression/formation protein HypC
LKWWAVPTLHRLDQRGKLMCLAIPMRLIEIDGACGVAEVDGVSRQVRLDLVPEVSLGDYILIHAGLAIARLDQEQAQETLSLLRSLADEVY